ncbi:MAG: DUF4350 domain-containing protein [Chloroflexi bacterium]|nr:DUF4350 domain-containing protein [Chloroflexota bacterium]
MRRDLIVVLVLFIVIGALAAILATRQQKPDENAPTFSTRSSAGAGAAALQIWLDALGYRTTRLENEPFEIDRAARALFVFPPFAREFDQEDVDALLRWTERGNTLIVSANQSTNRLLDALHARTRNLPLYARLGFLNQPLAGDAMSREIFLNTFTGLVLERNDYVAYVSAQAMPVVAMFAHGKGRVWLTSAPHLLTNDALKNEANAALIGAMLSDAPRGSVIAFDEIHLRPLLRARASQSLHELLYTTPVGWAFLYAGILTFAFLLINGKRFGRVLVLPQAIARRSPAEYVTSMAQLFRRAGKRQLAQTHYRHHLKRDLGRPYGINANLPDDEFIETLARHNPRLDRDALTRALRGLAQANIGEAALIKSAHHAVKILHQRGKP